MGTMNQPAPAADRVLLIVLDGCGCGEAPDAAEYGDVGANTLGHVAKAYPQLKLPNLARWGLGHTTPMPNVPALDTEQCVASFGRCRERSIGKDTTSGHWEPFATFPEGFPQNIVDRWIAEAKLPGVLGNCAASGTEIIKRLGEEHVRTGKPILYTSADSVWQVATHEDSFGLEHLYDICQVARGIADELQLGRVIARPFVGASADDFQRTHHRRDFSQTPPRKTVMQYVAELGLPTVGLGKIWNIFNGAGLQYSVETDDNADGLRAIIAALDEYSKGLIFVNLVDFDMYYGHRRDVPGFARALEEFDAFLPTLEQQLTPRDLVVISADHGIDPTYRGTDHTREFVPLLAYMPGVPACDLGTRDTYADIGQTVMHALSGKPSAMNVGHSFLPQMLKR